MKSLSFILLVNNNYHLNSFVGAFTEVNVLLTTTVNAVREKLQLIFDYILKASKCYLKYSHH